MEASIIIEDKVAAEPPTSIRHSKKQWELIQLHYVEKRCTNFADS